MSSRYVRVMVRSAIAAMLGLVPCTAATAQEASLGAALRSLGERAQVVFAGQVTSVRRTGSVVDIEFRVDEPMKGAPGASYVLREWAGLWAAGQRRYWVGERAVVFAHAPSASGLSSAVDGPEGVLPLTAPPDLAPGDVQAGTALLATRVLRSPGDPLPPSAALTLVDLRRLALQQATGDDDAFKQLPTRQAPHQPAPAVRLKPAQPHMPELLPQLHGLRFPESRDVLR